MEKKGFKGVTRFGDNTICLVELSYEKSLEDKMHKFAEYTDEFCIDRIINTKNGVELESVLYFSAVGIQVLYEAGKHYNKRIYFYPATVLKAKDYALKFGEYMQQRNSATDLACGLGLLIRQIDNKMSDKERTELNKMLFNQNPHKDKLDHKLPDKRLKKVDAFILGDDY